MEFAQALGLEATVTTQVRLHQFSVEPDWNTKIMADELIIYVADAGSVSKGNFHWVSSQTVAESSRDPRALAEAVASDLKSGKKVPLGYESPLFVPVGPNPDSLGWSNGPTEGHVGRLKLIKRTMFGRAGFDLLRARVLHTG
jgi:hypothetical protein